MLKKSLYFTILTLLGGLHFLHGDSQPKRGIIINNESKESILAKIANPYQKLPESFVEIHTKSQLFLPNNTDAITQFTCIWKNENYEFNEIDLLTVVIPQDYLHGKLTVNASNANDIKPNQVLGLSALDGMNIELSIKPKEELFIDDIVALVLGESSKFIDINAVDENQYFYVQGIFSEGKLDFALMCDKNTTTSSVVSGKNTLSLKINRSDPNIVEYSMAVTLGNYIKMMAYNESKFNGIYSRILYWDKIEREKFMFLAIISKESIARKINLNKFESQN